MATDALELARTLREHRNAYTDSSSDAREQFAFFVYSHSDALLDALCLSAAADKAIEACGEDHKRSMRSLIAYAAELKASMEQKS